MASSTFNSVIKRMLRMGRTTRGGESGGNFPIQQIGYMGKVGPVLMWFPYGIHANIPADVLTVLMALHGNAEARVGLPGSPKERNQNNLPTLAEGEVLFYHPGTGSYIHLKSEGDIDVLPAAGKKLTVKGDLAVEGVTTFEDDVTIETDLDVTGETALGATVTSNGKDISDTHTHVGSPSAPEGAVTNTGVPV